MAETVKFATNIPQELELKFDTGLPGSNDYGDYVQYALTDGRTMFLKPAESHLIDAAGIKRHMPFTMCKREKKVGNRRTTEMEVALLATPVQAPVAAPPPAKSSAAPETSTQGNGPSQSSNGSVNGTNGNAYRDASSLAAPLINSLFIQTGKAAVDAVIAVEAYATAQGLQVAFKEAQIQDLWVSLFIEYNKRGVR